MSQPLKGKTALVTGSTSGIGLGIAISLAKQGANIVLNGFGDHLPAQSHIEQLGVKVHYHGADMSKAKDIEEQAEVPLTMGGLWSCASCICSFLTSSLIHCD